MVNDYYRAATRQSSGNADGSCRFPVTDGEERFARVGPLFLGSPIRAEAIERVDLQAAGG